jgi:hypothetical protein
MGILPDPRPEEFPAHWPAARILMRELDVALEVSRRWLVQSAQVAPSRYFVDEANVWKQDYWGAQIKIMAYVLTGLPVPTVDQLTTIWRTPIAGYQFRGTSRVPPELTFIEAEQDDDQYPFQTYALIARRYRWCAIVGELHKREAWARRRQVQRGGKAIWAIGIEDLAPYTGPRAVIDPHRGDWTCAHGTFADGDRCFECEPIRYHLFPPQARKGGRHARR